MNWRLLAVLTALPLAAPALVAAAPEGKVVIAQGVDPTTLYQQMDLYGASKRLTWKARSDELIKAYDMMLK
jgi:hypothetical protein